MQSRVRDGQGRSGINGYFFRNRSQTRRLCISIISLNLGFSDRNRIQGFVNKQILELALKFTLSHSGRSRSIKNKFYVLYTVSEQSVESKFFTSPISATCTKPLWRSYTDFAVTEHAIFLIFSIRSFKKRWRVTISRLLLSIDV